MKSSPSGRFPIFQGHFQEMLETNRRVPHQCRRCPSARCPSSTVNGPPVYGRPRAGADHNSSSHILPSDNSMDNIAVILRSAHSRFTQSLCSTSNHFTLKNKILTSIILSDRQSKKEP